MRITTPVIAGLLLLAAPAAHADPAATLRGTLLERGTRAPLVGLIVRVPMGEAITDAAGRFVLPDLPAGPLEVRVEDDSVEPFVDRVTLTAGQLVDVTWYLAPSGASTAVRVVGRRPQGVVRRVIARTEIESVAGTNGDPLAVVQTLPGAARLPFGGNDLVLRGGGDTRAYVNGQWIPNAFHFGGLRSVLPGELVERLDVIPGNYGPAWGRGHGGVVTLNPRQPRTDRFGGQARADIYDAALVLEGPLTRHASVALAGRRSYIDAILPGVLGADSPFKTAPRYWDAQGVHDWRRGDHRVSTLIFGSSDTLALLFDEPAADDPAVRGGLEEREGWFGGQTTWRLAIDDDTHNTLMLGYLRFFSEVSLGDALDIDVRMHVFSLRDTIERRISDALTLRGGLDVELAFGAFAVTAPAPPSEGDLLVPLSAQPLKRADVRPHYLWPAAWVEGEATFGDLQLRPALRVDVAGEMGAAALLPRLSARYRATRSTTLQAAAGLYTQTPRPDQIDATFGNPDLGFERSQQYSLGVTQALGDWLSVGLTAFHKRITDAATPVSDPAIKVANQGEGRVSGVEVLLKRPAGGRFSGWIAYTLSRAERRDRPATPWRAFNLDQTHNLVVVGSLRLGADWAVGGRLRYVTGNPYTPYRGATFDSDSDVFVPVARGQNSGRLPAFHQLDLRVDKHWRFDTWIFTTYLEVQNVYARENPEDLAYNYDYTRTQRVAGMPLLPTFGLQGTF